MFKIVDQPISMSESRLDEAGGTVWFVGRVRNRNEGRAVLRLEYEAYGELAEKEGAAILEEAEARFEILSATCIHRTGVLEIGEVAIWVEVDSAHRDAAFRACRYIVDEVKARVPIWKKEHYTDGASGWINCAEAPDVFGKLYERQTRLGEVGPEGQAMLAAARVLVVGAGGLGSPALTYLAAAGIGTLGIVDPDRVDLTNLHRQPLYGHTDVGRPKAQVAGERLRTQSPLVRVEEHLTALDRENAEELVSGYDLVIDGTDNFRAKFLLNDVCKRLDKPLVQASIYRYEGEVRLILPEGPCLRCQWPEELAAGCVGSCAEVGVLGVLPGVFGTIQASEAIKHLLGLPSPLTEGQVLWMSLIDLQTTLIALDRRPGCAGCVGRGGESPAHEVFLRSPDDLNKFLLVDIRERDEIEEAPLPVPAEWEPGDSFDRPAADRPLLLVCESGVRSEVLALQLRQQGREDVFSLARGRRALENLR